MLDILKLLFCMPFLLYACYSDIKKRRVTNDVWLIMLAGSIFFILYDTSKYGISYIS
jgi:preflagellin peptidase FlaK